MFLLVSVMAVGSGCSNMKAFSNFRQVVLECRYRAVHLSVVILK